MTSRDSRREAPRRLKPAARFGFTLVELMVVVGIISLLIAIVLPAVNAARDQARVATTRAMISVLETGVEQFRADHLVGGDYPPSPHLPVTNPHDLVGSRLVVGGANLIVWALAGADLLGTPGFRNIDGVDDPFGGWISDTGRGDLSDLYYLESGRPYHSRSGPFVDIDKLKFPEQAAPNTALFIIPVAGRPTVNSLCFLDSFDQPILYYKANPAAVDMVCDEDPSLPEGSVMSGSYSPPGIYNLADNSEITGSKDRPGVDLGAGPLPEDPSRLHYLGYRDDSEMPVRNFARTIHNPNITSTLRPHRSDSFILISPGPDALYGTADDIANFEVNK